MPSQALAQDGINVGQRWAILKRRQSLRTNYPLNKIVRFLLYIWLQNHRKDEIHQYTGCLVQVSLAWDQNIDCFLLTVSVPAIREKISSA